MRLLRIDFERRTRAPSWGGWMLLAASLMALALQLHAFRDLRFDEARLEDHAQRLRARDAKLAAKPLSAQALRVELERARSVSQQLMLPWGQLFHAVESAAEDKIALIALQPESARGLVRITAEAKDLQQVLQFVARLATRPTLRDVHLASHQVWTDDERQPVRFVVIASLAQEPAS